MPHRTRLSLALPALLVAFALPACGGSDSQTAGGPYDGGSEGTAESPEQNVNGAGGDEISAADAAEVQDAQRTIKAACDTGAPGGTQDAGEADVPAAVDTVLLMIRRNGLDGVYETGNVDRAKQLRAVAVDLASQLDTCGQPAQAQRLKAVAD